MEVLIVSVVVSLATLVVLRALYQSVTETENCGCGMANECEALRDAQARGECPQRVACQQEREMFHRELPS